MGSSVMMREFATIQGVVFHGHGRRVAAEEFSNKMRIEARAPTRIDLAGGTLDIWPLYLFHPPAFTLNCAINLYASCTLETRANTKSMKLVSLDTNQCEQFPSWSALADSSHYRLPLLAQFAKCFPWPRGLTITTNSQAPAGAGI